MLFTDNDDATVLVVLVVRLNGVAERLYGHTAGSDAFLLQGFGHFIGASLGITYIELRITCAAVGIALDADTLLRIFVAPVDNLVQNGLGIRIAEADVVEEDFFQRLVLYNRLGLGFGFRLHDGLGSGRRSRSLVDGLWLGLYNLLLWLAELKG